MYRVCHLIIIAAWAATGGLPANATEAPQSPNVLLICVDDLRLDHGEWGAKRSVTPQIDRLAREGRFFRNHFVQIAACGPSRCTLLTGQRVASSWDVWGGARKKPEPRNQFVSFPHLFRRSGYATVCIGKVSNRPGGVLDAAQAKHEVPFSWDRTYAPTGPWKTPWGAFFGYEHGEAYNRVISGVQRETPRLPYERGAENAVYPDQLNADAAIEELRKLSAGEKPFLLAVGFYNPHCPYSAPASDWDACTPDVIGTSPCPDPAKNTDPKISLHRSLEVTGHYKWPGGAGNVAPDQWKTLRQAYYAATRYVDRHIGRVLDEYRRLGLDKNTIVILWSDHGYHVGDHGLQGKLTSHDASLRSPLIIRIPGQGKPGVAAEGIVETIDIYPTLVGLCKLDNTSITNLPGADLSRLVDDPNTPGKNAALSHSARGKNRALTYRTERYRVTRWTNPNGKVLQMELYDHAIDPLETDNIAAEHPELVERLVKEMRSGKTFLKPRSIPQEERPYHP